MIGFEGSKSCSSSELLDEGVIDDDDLNICWCCWASKAAWCGLETMAINAPVVGSINGGVVAEFDDVDKANDLYAEPNGRLVKSLLWPLRFEEKKFDRECFDEWESKRWFEEYLFDEWEWGESKQERITFLMGKERTIISYLIVGEDWAMMAKNDQKRINGENEK